MVVSQYIDNPLCVNGMTLELCTHTYTCVPVRVCVFVCVCVCACVRVCADVRLKPKGSVWCGPFTLES